MNTVVFSICLYNDINNTIHVKKLIGTGFFINKKGVFLTASHIIKQANDFINNSNLKVALFPTDPNSDYEKKLVVPILKSEFSPKPNDIAIGLTGYKSPTFFDLENIKVGGWKNVATVGYPTSYVNELPHEYQIQQRCLKGYVQREIQKGRHSTLDNPPLFELSFPITRGLSGAPLFVHSKPNEKLIGVCVGSIQSSIVDYEHLEVEDGKSTYKERNLRIEEYGIADDIRPLLNWKPKILEGKSLVELSKI